MYYNLIKNYVERLTIEDIRKYSISQGITLTEDEEKVLLEYAKKYWQTFYYGNPRGILEELKIKLSSETYNKIETLYMQLKDKLN